MKPLVTDLDASARAIFRSDGSRVRLEQRVTEDQPMREAAAGDQRGAGAAVREAPGQGRRRAFVHRIVGIGCSV